MTRLYYYLLKKRGQYRPDLLLLDTDGLCERILGTVRAGRPKGVTFDAVKAMELYKLGKSDREISQAVGVSHTSVNRWRKGLKLPVNIKKDRLGITVTA